MSMLVQGVVNMPSTISLLSFHTSSIAPSYTYIAARSDEQDIPQRPWGRMLGRYNTVFTHLTILIVLLAVTLSNTMSPIKLDSAASSSQGELSSQEEIGNPVLDVATLLKTMDFAATVSTTICGEGNAACVIGRSLTSRFESWCDSMIETRESTEKEQACYTLYQPSPRTSVRFASSFS
jgi:hypothetical protein